MVSASNGVSTSVYLQKANEVEDAYEAYRSKQAENFSKRQALESQITAIDGKIKTNKSIELEFKKTWLGYFVSKIAFSSGVILKITKLLCKIFPSAFSNEVNVQRQVRKELIDYAQAKSKLDEDIKGLSSELFLLENTYQAKLKNYNIWAKNHNQETMLGADQRIWALFGGRAEFEKLPVFDLGDRVQKYIDFIDANDLTAPMMRGTDKLNREFVVFRDAFSSMYFVCQTMFRFYSDNATWTTAGAMIGTKISNNWIIQNGIVDREVYAQWAKLIKARLHVL